MKTLFTQLPIYPTKPPIILTYLYYTTTTTSYTLATTIT